MNSKLHIDTNSNNNNNNNNTTITPTNQNTTTSPKSPSKMHQLPRSKLHNSVTIDWLAKRYMQVASTKYLILPEELEKHEEIKSIFEQFDEDKSGKLSVGELYVMMHNVNIGMEKSDLENICKHVDLDRDNALNLKEFKNCALSEKADEEFKRIIQRLRDKYKSNSVQQQPQQQKDKKENIDNISRKCSGMDDLEYMTDPNRNDKDDSYTGKVPYFPGSIGTLLNYITYKNKRKILYDTIKNSDLPLNERLNKLKQLLEIQMQKDTYATKNNKFPLSNKPSAQTFDLGLNSHRGEGGILQDQQKQQEGQGCLETSQQQDINTIKRIKSSDYMHNYGLDTSNEDDSPLELPGHSTKADGIFLHTENPEKPLRKKPKISYDKSFKHEIDRLVNKAEHEAMKSLTQRQPRIKIHNSDNNNNNVNANNTNNSPQMDRAKTSSSPKSSIASTRMTSNKKRDNKELIEIPTTNKTRYNIRMSRKPVTSHGLGNLYQQDNTAYHRPNNDLGYNLLLQPTQLQKDEDIGGSYRQEQQQDGGSINRQQPKSLQSQHDGIHHQQQPQQQSYNHHHLKYQQDSSQTRTLGIVKKLKVIDDVIKKGPNDETEYERDIQNKIVSNPADIKYIPWNRLTNESEETNHLKKNIQSLHSKAIKKYHLFTEMNNNTEPDINFIPNTSPLSNKHYKSYETSKYTFLDYLPLSTNTPNNKPYNLHKFITTTTNTTTQMDHPSSSPHADSLNKPCDMQKLSIFDNPCSIGTNSSPNKSHDLSKPVADNCSSNTNSPDKSNELVKQTLLNFDEINQKQNSNNITDKYSALGYRKSLPSLQNHNQLSERFLTYKTEDDQYSIDHEMHKNMPSVLIEDIKRSFMPKNYKSYSIYDTNKPATTSKTSKNLKNKSPSFNLSKHASSHNNLETPKTASSQTHRYQSLHNSKFKLPLVNIIDIGGYDEKAPHNQHHYYSHLHHQQQPQPPHLSPPQQQQQEQSQYSLSPRKKDYKGISLPATQAQSSQTNNKSMTETQTNFNDTSSSIKSRRPLKRIITKNASSNQLAHLNKIQIRFPF